MEDQHPYLRRLYPQEAGTRHLSRRFQGYQDMGIVCPFRVSGSPALIQIG